MSDRERWIVYPLLLLALGSSLRMKMFGTEKLHVHRELDAQQIRCRELILHNEKGQALLVMAPSSDGTHAIIDGSPVIIPHLRSQEIGIIDRAGHRAVTLNAVYTKEDGKLAGGRVIVFDGEGNEKVVVGGSHIGGSLIAIGEDKQSVAVGHAILKDGARWAGMYTIDKNGHITELPGTRFEPSEKNNPKLQPKAKTPLTNDH